MNHLRLVFQALRDFRRIEHTVADGIIDFVEDYQIPRAGLDRPLTLRPCFFHHPHILGVGFLGSDFHETAPHLLHHELVTEGLHSIEFAIMPRAFEELQHEHFHALPHRPESCAHGGCGLAFAWTGIHDDQTTADVLHTWDN